MVLDRQTMKWVKDTLLVASTAVREREEDEESEDPFRDIESLRDEDSTHPSEQEEESESRIEEVVEDTDDPEEAVLNSFSFDDSSIAIVPVMTGITRPDDGDSEDSGVAVDDPLTDSDESLEEEFKDYTGQQHEEITDDVSLREFPAPPPRKNAVFSTPVPLRPSTITSAGATPFPSAGRSGTVKSDSVTPVSALKDPNRSKAPVNLKHRRSVSFSDGKRDGPIRGLNGKLAEASDCESGTDILGKSGIGCLFEPSVRSKRIAGMLDDLQDDCRFGSLSVVYHLTFRLLDEDESPSKASSSTTRPITDEIQPLSASRPASLDRSSGWDTVRRSLSRSQTHRPSANPNATFLTECSFGVAHDRLVQVITDIQPFEPHWESLKSIDLSKKSIESVARLKEFLPQLDCLSL
jgi:hypothetical protein